MKKFLLTCVLALWILPAQAYTPPTGFRGIPWGTDVSTLRDEMFLVNENQVMSIYARYTEKYAVGEANLLRVQYCFYKGRFYAAFLEFEGHSNFLPLKEAMTAIHGPGLQSNRFVEKYIWGIQSRVTISLDYSPATTKGTLFFVYTPIADEQRADDRQKGKAAGKDL